MLVPAVVSAAPGVGDVTVVVQNQAGTSIEGAKVNLFWNNWLWMSSGVGPIPAKFTDASGSATYSAAEIATWRTANGSPTKFQVTASDINGNYGNVYTWAVSDEMPCIAYSAGTTYTFTYKLIMFAKAAPTVVWGTETVTVTYTMGEALTIVGPVAKIGFFHGPLAVATTNIFQAYPKAGGGWDFYDMIDTDEVAGITPADYVTATASGTSLSATVPLRFLAGITDNIIAVPFLVKTPVTHIGLSSDELSAAEDMYGVGSSVTLGLMTLASESVGMTADVPAPIISISVSPLSIDFGRLYAGQDSAIKAITVTNTSPIVSVHIDAEVMNESRPLFYATNLKLDLSSVVAWMITSLAHGVSQPVSAVLSIPIDTDMGTLTATLVFWAEEV
jgi:hypothetical protein